MIKNSLIICVALVFTSCATVSKWNSDFDKLESGNKILINALVGLGVGAVIGNSTGTTPETKKNLTFMFSGFGLSTGLIYGVNKYHHSDISVEKFRQLEKDNKLLLDTKLEYEKLTSMELISKGKTESENTPPELREYLKKGRWERYKLLRWSQDPEDENIYYKVVEQIKLIPSEVTGD